MIPIKELLYDIDLKLNKIGSNEHQGIDLENKIIVINDAIINIIKTKFSENNLYKSGLDSFQKRYNDLEGLIVKDKELILKDEGSPLNIWSADLSKLTPEYMLGIPGSEYITATKGSCSDRILAVTTLAKHGSIHTILRNSNTRPSFEYQETVGTISGHKWQVYTDGSFKPNKLYLWYIKYPVKVDFPGYDHFDGSASKEVNSELPYYLKEEIVDIAVRNLALSTENQSAVQSSQIRIQTGE